MKFKINKANNQILKSQISPIFGKLQHLPATISEDKETVRVKMAKMSPAFIIAGFVVF